MNAFSFTNGVPELAEGRGHLMEESLVAIHEIDTNGVIRYVNQAECQLLGYAPHELIDHYIWEFVAVEERQASREGIRRKITRQQPIGVFKREFRRADGTYLWVEIHETLLENAGGEVIGIRSGLFDVTDRHKFDLEIQKQHDRMKCLLQSWSRAIVTADALGHVDFMNPAAEALTGWPQQDALGRPLEAICRVLHDSGEPFDLLSCILAESMTGSVARQSPILDRSGTWRRASWTSSPIRNDNGVIIGIALVLEEC